MQTLKSYQILITYALKKVSFFVNIIDKIFNKVCATVSLYISIEPCVFLELL